MDNDSGGSGASDDGCGGVKGTAECQPLRVECPQHHAPLTRLSSGLSAGTASTTTAKDDEVFVDGVSPPPSSHVRSRRHDTKSTIRQHYYPEGGWGWVITACVFMVHVLTTGMQLSYGILYVEILRHFGTDFIILAGWLGVLCFAVSLFLAPFVVALCRRKSTRLSAVFGGLVMALACLFASFAQQMHQVLLSYGVLLGIGIGLTRETSNLMIGQYFKRRREFIEIIIQSGSGIGIALISVLLKESVHSIGWRLGLQAVTGVMFTCFVLGMFYRSASLYHPQRRAILHLKIQKKKIKDKSKMEDKPPYFDFTTLRQNTLQIIMLATGTAALGLYTPIFCLMLQGTQEGLEPSSLILLQTFIGFAFAVGCVGFGLVVVRQSEQCTIARQYLCQAALFGLGFSILALTAVQGYHGYVLFVWIYGIFLGGYHYSLKMFTYEKVRTKLFSRAWGFVQWAQSLPVLFGVPISVYINSGQGPKTGYYFSCTFTLVGAGAFFLLNIHKRPTTKPSTTVSFASLDSHSSLITPHGTTSSPDGDIFMGVENGLPSPEHEYHLAHPHLHHPGLHPAISRLGKTISFATSVDVIDDKQQQQQQEYLTCISEEAGLHEAIAVSDYYPGECIITPCDKVENYLLYNEYENNQLEVDSTEEERNRSLTPPPPPPAPCTSPNDPEELAVVVVAAGTASNPVPASSAPQGVPPRPHRRDITVIEEMTTSV